MVRMATHASPTSRNIIRSRPAARPDFLHVSVARRHIDKLAARPTVRRRQARNMYNAPTTSDLGRPTRLSACICRPSTHWPPSVHAKSARTTARLWLLPYVCVVDKSKHGPIPAARPEPDFLHVSWLGWLLIPAASVCMRRRQVETWSDLGRLPDPTFCMYLSPVDTSINGPPARPSVHAKSVCLSNVLPTCNFCNLYHSNLKSSKGECLRPYHVENTSSRLIPEVKQRRAVLVLGRVTAWEYAVL